MPRCLDVEQMLASLRCTASFRHNHGTVCRAVLDVLQVLASSHCTGCLASAGIFFLCPPQVFLTTTAPCAALCWMSCKCSLLRAAPQVVVRTRHRVPRCAGSLASARFFAPHSRFSSPQHLVPRCAGCLASARFFAQHRTFSSQRHLVPRCAGCLANARIFAQHRTFLSQESTPCRMCQNHSEPNVSEPLRTFTNKNASSLLECIINLLLSLLACCRVLK